MLVALNSYEQSVELDESKKVSDFVSRHNLNNNVN
jgi:hypothetical protein